MLANKLHINTGKSCYLEFLNSVHGIKEKSIIYLPARHSIERMPGEWILQTRISSLVYKFIHLQHSVESSLATVPASQAVQEEAPAVLTEFSSHLTQDDMSASLYVPASHLSAEWYKSCIRYLY